MASWVKYGVVDKSLGSNKVEIINRNKIVFNYPCESTFKCTDYHLVLKPGFYKFEAYGASGGTSENYITAFRRNKKCFTSAISGIQSNVECSDLSSTAGAGGYTMGEIRIDSPLNVFLSIGGKGMFGSKINELNTDNCYKKENMNEGGYNGGGYSSNYYESESIHDGTGSGGGSTDFRFDENDVFHRVLVAGGGGGSDNHYGTLGGNDDGSGGAGGGLTAQGFFVNGVEDFDHLANQTFGFSFGSGESVQKDRSRNEHGCVASGSSDRAGSGGGWFGGFASNSGTGGGGGGSSFVLTSDAEIPAGKLLFTDSFYENEIEEEYAFADKTKYLFDSYLTLSGVWSGNGFAVITLLNPIVCTIPKKSGLITFHPSVFLALFI